jgi:enoyl-CoA hydratase/carnithine racemase
MRMLTDRVHRVSLALDELGKPVIAAMRGVAVGAGLDMALLCDMRIAGESARLSEGYIKVGLVPGDGGAWLLPRLVGPAKAMELLMTGDFIDAAEALRLGLVNQVVPDSQVVNAAYDLANRIAAQPPVQIAMIRRLVHQAERIDLRTHYDLVSSHFGLITSLEDYAEAGAALRARRDGKFHGR